MNSCSHSPIFSPRQQRTAPSYTLRARFGITRCSSIPITLPKPSHSGQAPRGELNENIWSFGSSNLIPSASNLVLKENSCVLPSAEQKRRRQFPSPSYMAVSAESVRRLILSLLSSAVMRSTSRQMFCFLSSAAVCCRKSSIRTISRFTSIRVNPCFKSISSCWSSVRPSRGIIGVRTVYFVPLGKESIQLTISSILCFFTSCPLMGE